MTKKLTIQLFEAMKVRTVWDDEQEKWYFSIVDVCEILTEQPDTEHARNYWKVLKHRLRKEGNETVTNCNRLKLRAADGKMRLTDVAWLCVLLTWIVIDVGTQKEAAILTKPVVVVLERIGIRATNGFIATNGFMFAN